MKIYNIGILGCANIAIRSLIPSFKQHPRTNVLAIGSRFLEKAQKIACQYDCRAYGSYDEVINDPDIDIVYIPLPTSLHKQYVMKALNAGKHVLAEKSLGCTYQEVLEMTEFAQKKNLLLMENFQFRFHTQTAWIRNVLANGVLGEIRCFRSQFGFPPFADPNNIRYQNSLGGGALLDAGAYTVKSMNVFFPEETFMFKSSSMIYPQANEVDIYGGAHFESSKGIIAELAYGFDNYYQCGFEIWGSKGKLTSTRAYTAPKNLEPIVFVETANGKTEYKLPSCDHFICMIEHLVTTIDCGLFVDEYKQNTIQAFNLDCIKKYKC